MALVLSSTYNLLDDDDPPVIRIRGVNVGDTRANDATPNTGPNGEARFLEGSNGTTSSYTFTVELLSAGVRSNGLTRQPELLENGAPGPLVTSYLPINFNYDFQSGNGVDPTASGQAPDSATLNTDFTGPAGGTGNTTIAAGQHSTTIPFTVNGDNEDENNESFLVRVLSPTNVSNPQGTQAYGVILDDDAPNVTISPVSVTEGAPNAVTTAAFRVELSRTSVQTIKINYVTQDITANAAIVGPNTTPDYNFTSGTLTFNPGQTLQFVNVPVIGDNLSEDNETFRVQLSPNGGNLYSNFVTIPETVTRGLTFTNGGAAIGTILDDDKSVISIADANIAEGSGPSGTQTTITFRLTLAGLSQNAVTVTATTQAGPAPNTGTVGAIEGDDYVQTSNTVTFAPGTTQAIFQVLVNSDTIDETNETFLVNLTNPSSNATISRTQAVGTIIDDDGPNISITDVSKAEGNSGATPFAFTVSLSAASPQQVSVNYQTLDGDGNPATPNSAISSGVNADYVPQIASTLVFAPGETTKTITVNVNGDTVRESDEFFTVLLSGAVNADPTAPITKARGIGNISNDDNQPVISVQSVSTTEGSPITFTIRLSNPSTQPITVDYTTDDPTAPGTATPGVDYNGTNGTKTATFSPATANAGGQTDFTVTIPTVTDNADEPDETFTLVLSNPTGGATLGNAQATGTIVDNNPQSVFISDVTANEGNDGTNPTRFTFTVSLGTPGAVTPAAQNAQSITLNYSTADGTAVSTGAAADYQAVTNGTVVIPAGQNTGTFDILVKGDTISELNETFRVTISNPATPVPARATIVRNTATGTINNDDTSTASLAGNVSQIEGNSGNSTFVFNVNLNNPSDRTVTVNYSLTAGTATAGSDFSAVVTPITFAPGETTKPINVSVVGDLLNEANETFTVTLTGADMGVVIGGAPAIGTILNDDAVPGLSVGNVTVREGDSGTTNADFVVTLTPVSGQTVTVDYSTAPGTATAGTDYTTTSGTLTFVAGTTTRTISVPVVGDTIDEANETFTLNLSNPTNATVTSAQGIGTITDDDAQNVSIGDVTMNEGNSGTTNFIFPLTLGAGVTGAQNAQDIVLNYTVTNGTATSPSDYQATSGQVTIPAGQNTANITVAVVGDVISEANETFTVTISNPATPVPVRAVLVKDTAVGTIVNDDMANFSFGGPNNGDVSGVEGNTGNANSLQFTVRLSTPSDRTLTVNFNTTAGTTNPATPGSDFTSTSGQLTFAAGETTKTVTVPIIGDVVDEANETLLVTLSGASAGSMISGTGTATGTILDDDGAPELSIGDATVTEGDSGITNANFTVTLQPASGQPVTVDYATANNTATSPADYANTSGTLTFAVGETTKTITVPVAGDTVDETDETFTVNLTNPNNVTVTNTQGIGTIIDDDGPTISAADVSVNESAGSVDVTVTLSAPSPQPVSVNFATADISANANTDYSAVSGTLDFAVGQDTRTITIPIIDDTFNEPVETFAVNLTNAVNATILDTPAIVTINDNDDVSAVSINDATVTEGNSGTVNAVFTVTLNRPSLQNVTVVYKTANGTAEAGSDFVDATDVLTFAPRETSKTVTVVVKGDVVAEGNETFTVNLSNVNGASIADGVGLGTIIDDDQAALVLTITPAALAEGNAAQGTLTRNTQAKPALAVSLTSSNPSLVGVPANVTIPAGSASVTFPVQAVEDQIAGPGGSSVVTARATGFTPANATVTVTDNDTPRLALAVASTLLSEGGPSTTATLSRNTPTDVDLTVTLQSSDTNSITVPATVTIPAGQQSVTFAVTPVDNSVSDGTREVIVSATRAGFTPSTVSVKVTVSDNDSATIIVTPTELRTSEAGDTATFTVRLTSQPTANVIVNLANGDTTEGTLSTTALTFTPQNFSLDQSVTVTGVDDLITDGPITYFITTTTSSDDATYAAIDPADVQVTNTDNDVAGFIVAPRGIRTTENGGSDSFAIRLTSQPTADVVIGLSVDNERKASLSTSSLTFTPQNFATPQRVVVTGRDDAVRDGTVIYNIITAPAVSADRAYNGLNPSDVKAASTDNDASSIVVRPNVASGLRVTEGQRSFFTVRLTSQPTAPVRISLSSSDPSEASLPQSVVVLDSNNFREGVQVAVDGVADGVADGPQRFLIRTDGAESADRLYNLPGGAIADIGGVCLDVNSANLVIAGPTSSITSEDGTTTQFSVRLSSRPVSAVRVRLTSSDLTEGVVENSGNATFLTFTTDNFATPQTVTVTGRDDSIEDGSQRYNINLLAQTASGPFNNVTAVVPLVNTDNDDLTKPVISLTGVSGRVLRPGDVRAITGQATDANGIARISVVIQKTDGTTPTFLNSDGTFGETRVALTATFNATSGEFSLPIPGGTLPVGTYVVEATATDRAGNVSAPDRLSFTISDRLLDIVITTPADGSVLTRATNVAGSVRSLTGSPISSVTVTLQSGSGNPRNVPATLNGNNFSTASLGVLPAGTYKVTATVADNAGNRQTATSTFIVDTVAPTSVTITNPTNDAVVDNITTISGQAIDNAGGSGIARVELVILRNTDGRYFNGRTFVDGFATVPATVSGNNFVLNISGGLPADPDPLNATYTLQAIAFDRAGSSVRSDTIRVFLSSNGSAPGTQASQVSLSPVRYSSGAAKASDVILNFTGALNASAAQVANYQVTVNGAALDVESAIYRGSSSKISLADALETGDKVEVTYNMQDAQGRTLKGKAAITAK